MIPKEKRGFSFDILNTVLHGLYTLRRHIHFPIEKGMNLDNLEAALNKKLGNVRVKNEPRWQYRYPVNASSDKTKERFVINANPDPKLIETLDKFCSEENACYKVAGVDDWTERVDTAVIYMQDHITPEQQKKFIRLITPFVRQTNPQHTNTLDGTLIAPGIAMEKEVSREEAKEYVANLPKSLQEGVSSFLKKDGKIGMSLGQKCVLDEFIPVYSNLFPQNGLQLGHQTKIEKHQTITPVKSGVEKSQSKTNMLKRLEAFSQPSAPITSKDGVRNFSELGMTKTSPTSLFYKKEVAGQNLDILDSLQMYKMLKNQDLRTVRNIYSRALMHMDSCANNPQKNIQDYLLAYGVAYSCVARFADEKNLNIDIPSIKNNYIETVETIFNGLEKGISPSSDQLERSAKRLRHDRQLRAFDTRLLPKVTDSGFSFDGMNFKSTTDSRAFIKDIQVLNSKNLMNSMQEQH
jgi:hypothetical protein